MFPDNIFRATFQQVESEYVAENITMVSNANKTLIETMVHKHVDGMNILGILNVNIKITM